MILKEYGKYTAVCDICGKEGEIFDNWEDCLKWIKENWGIEYNSRNKDFGNICNECMGE